MIHLCNDINQFQAFSEYFRKTFESKEIIDLSKIPSASLADECETIFKHHKDCAVFLGYLEPGWMLELPNQTRIRKLFRKFPVGIIIHFNESIPFSWKNEIETIYSFNPLNQNGNSNIINNGSSLHNQP